MTAAPVRGGEGEALGLAFQVYDDLLDATADAGSLGKTPGKDAVAGKRTYVSILGLEQAMRLSAARPVFGHASRLQTDPHFRDHVLFYEYFHGDNGAGLGASHQTGWTGLVARMIQLFGYLDSTTVLDAGVRAKTLVYRKDGSA